MQEQQTSSNQPDATDQAPTDPPPESPRGDADSTWGLGSASALDNLRRHDFRGRRSRQGEDKPTSR